MNSKALFAFLVFTSSASLLAAEPKELVTARSEYEHATPRDEAARTRYLTSLVPLRDKFARANATADWQAVDAEMRHHPVSKDADPKALSALIVGRWTSPRHEYLDRKDGTWVMLPEEAGSPHGHWHVEGNQFVSTDSTDPKKPSRYTILLLTPKDFVFTDGKIVFYETRSHK